MWLFLCVGVTLLACVACLTEEDYCDGDVTHKKKLGEIVNLIWYAQLATPWILIFTPSDTNIKCCYDTSNGTYCSELEPEWLTRDPSCPELPHSVGQEAGPRPGGHPRPLSHLLPKPKVDPPTIIQKSLQLRLPPQRKHLMWRRRRRPARR